MAMLQRWLDPPATIARKRALRALRGSGHSGEDRQFEVGCLVPIGFVLAVALGLGVLIGTAWHQASTPAPREQVVRVIDDGAPGGPQVIATAVVRWP
jgi:hypothetical protein